MKKLRVSILALLLVLALAPFMAFDAAAQDEFYSDPVDGAMGDAGFANSSDPDDAYGFHGWIAKYLNLSKDQLDKVRALRNSYFMETRDLRFKLMIQRLEFWRLFTDPKANQAAILAQAKNLEALRQQLFDTKMKMFIQGRSILNPDQIVKLDILIGKIHRGMRGFGMQGCCPNCGMGMDPGMMRGGGGMMGGGMMGGYGPGMGGMMRGYGPGSQAAPGTAGGAQTAPQ